MRFVIRLAVVLLAACRAVYCWMFLFWSCVGLYFVCTRIRLFAETHLVEKGEIFTDVTFAVYSIVFGVAWWMIFRRKPASTKWAIAGNLVFILNYAPALLSGNWRGVLEAEREWWPVILVGIFGIIIFSIPYHGWRNKPQILVNSVS